jgi:hypothetical protein
MQEGKKPQQHGDPGSEGTRTAPTAGQGDQQTKVGSQGHRPDEPDDDGATRGERESLNKRERGCAARQANRPFPEVREWAVAGRRAEALVATGPSPEGSVVARDGRSPGFGPSLAFPVSQWRA